MSTCSTELQLMLYEDNQQTADSLQAWHLNDVKLPNPLYKSGGNHEWHFGEMEPLHCLRENERAVEVEPAPRHAGTHRMRRRNLDGASTSMAEDVQQEEIEEEEQEQAYYGTKSSKKKEMKKQEKEARRQAEDASRDIRKQKQDRYSEMRRRKDEEREAEELRKEEEGRLQRLKQEEAANAEFEKWKDAFTVENEGTMEDETNESGGLLHSFVEYIKKHKCVQLEDLAAEFHLRTQDAISRIVSLEELGHLSGVMDDRGKFIYISFEEMKAVAEYIKTRGRVSIAHLASKSNEFIDLEPKVIEGNMDDVIS